VVGLGKTRRVILADNLINDFTVEEIEGVLAHEFAHHKLFHMQKLIVFGIASSLLSFYLLYVFSSKALIALGGENIYDIMLLPVFLLILFLAGFFTLPLQNGFSRMLEREADSSAVKTTQNREAFTSLMNKLAERNLADPNPSKLVKILFYSHPPISERIEMAKRV
jgi:STE24 endopeptidase